MSDMNWEPSEEEREANRQRLLAEAEKHRAEAETFRVEAENDRITGAFSKLRLDEYEIEVAQKLEEETRRKAKDAYNRVYRFMGEVQAATVKNAISTLTEWYRMDSESPIEIIFSSPGGSIFDGMELFDFIVELGDRGVPTITGGAGMAASMAGILVQSGKQRYLTKECWFLIHRAAFLAMGQTFQIEDRVQLIKRIEDRIINIFVVRSGKKMTVQRIRKNWERKDWWLSSDQCLELGLIDEIRASSSGLMG